jgi:hypothetical protein
LAKQDRWDAFDGHFKKANSLSYFYRCGVCSETSCTKQVLVNHLDRDHPGTYAHSGHAADTMTVPKQTGFIGGADANPIPFNLGPIVNPAPFAVQGPMGNHGNPPAFTQVLFGIQATYSSQVPFANQATLANLSSVVPPGPAPYADTNTIGLGSINHIAAPNAPTNAVDQAQQQPSFALPTTVLTQVPDHPVVDTNLSTLTQGLAHVTNVGATITTTQDGNTSNFMYDMKFIYDEEFTCISCSGKDGFHRHGCDIEDFMRSML